MEASRVVFRNLQIGIWSLLVESAAPLDCSLLCCSSSFESSFFSSGPSVDKFWGFSRKMMSMLVLAGELEFDAVVAVEDLLVLAADSELSLLRTFRPAGAVASLMTSDVSVGAVALRERRFLRPACSWPPDSSLEGFYIMTAADAKILAL